MCEFLVMARDKINPTCVYMNSQEFKRGDVVSEYPDGHNWGKVERSHPDFRIIRIAGVDPVRIQMRRAPPAFVTEADLSRRRFVTFDLSLVDQAWLEWDFRTQLIFDIDPSSIDFDAAFVIRQPVAGHPPSNGVKAEVKKFVGAK